jgi:enolase
MRTIDDALAATYDVYQSAAEIVFESYGMRLLTADEGGLAPPFESAASMIETAIEAIARAGYTPGADFNLAIDVASSHFYADGRYTLDGRSMTARK